jgi:glutathione S-transferase
MLANFVAAPQMGRKGAVSMLVLRSSPASPFGRKIRIAAAILGLSDQIEVVQADTNDPNDALRQQNPLGKIPTLILEDGRVVFDSAVIAEYLDELAGGGGIIPTEPKRRLHVLTQQALADGLMDAALLQVYEARFREPDQRVAKWLDYQGEKITRVLAVLERGPPDAGAIDIAAIALACALGYLDLRFAGHWRSAHPRLVAWLDGFAEAVPAFEATRAKV